LLSAGAGTSVLLREKKANPFFVVEGFMAWAVRGFLYRWAIRIKDFGERHRIDFLIRWGLALKDRL